MMLHATGSWQFNKFVRGRAMARGYKLNQYGLYDRGSDEVVLRNDSELPFFLALGIPYVEPENRSVGKEFEVMETYSRGQVLIRYRISPDGFEVVNRSTI